MKALSLWQPWALLTVLGAKKIETRSWGTRYRGPLLIHAAKTFRKADRLLCLREPFAKALVDPTRQTFARGAIIGRCDLVDVRFMGLGFEFPPEPERSFGLYELGRYAWMFKNVVRFKQPIPYRGGQRIFNVPDELIREAV
jgi:hypothetical protein